MGLVCLSRNHHHAGLSEREQLHFSEAGIKEVLHALRQDAKFPECALLCTCNRTELFFRGPAKKHVKQALAILGKFSKGATPTLENMELFTGETAVRHLFRVAAGLESLVVGENEILGQLKTAYRIACEAEANGFFTNECFHNAFRIGKRVRTETNLCAGGTSVGTVAVEQASEAGQVKGKRVLVIGAGEIGGMSLRAARGHGAASLTLANRTTTRTHSAAALAEEYGASLVPLDNLAAEIARHDTIFSATASPDYIVTPALVGASREASPLAIYDLALPRDIDPQIAAIPGVTLRTIDEMRQYIEQTLEMRAAEIPNAEAIVEEGVADYIKWLHELAAVPSIKRLLEMGNEIRASELARIAPNFSPEQLAAIEHAGHRMLDRLTRSIIDELKRTSRNSVEAHIERDFTRLL